MSFFRTAAVSTLIVGAGLGSMAGLASAHESAPAKGCSNTVEGSSSNGAGRTLGDTTGGDQDFSATNLCDILNGNKIGSGNNAAATGDIVNGDTTTTTTERNSASSTSVITDLLPV
jgi:hypothetical protein